MMTYMRLASLSAAAVVLAVTFIIVPSSRIDAPMILAAALLASASAMIFSPPIALRRSGSSESGTFASIGIFGSIISVVFLLSFAVYLLALFGFNRTLVSIGLIITAGIFLFGYFILSAGISYIDTNHADSGIIGFISRAQVLNEYEAKMQSGSGELERQFRGMIDDLRFAPNDLPDQPSPQNAQLLDLVKGSLGEAIFSKNNAEFQEARVRFYSILKDRDTVLRASRRKN